MVYEKRKISGRGGQPRLRELEEGIPQLRPAAERVDMDDCGFCQRKKCTLLCQSCGYTIQNSRVSLVCTNHPKAVFMMDLKACPSCKRITLKECNPGEVPPPPLAGVFSESITVANSSGFPSLGFNFSPNAPAFVAGASAPPNSIPILGFPVMKSPFKASEKPAELPTLNFPAPAPSIAMNPKPIQKDTLLGFPEQAASVSMNIKPAGAPTTPPRSLEQQPGLMPSPPPAGRGRGRGIARREPDCTICSRRVNVVYCINCGYFSDPGSGVRKYIRCPAHPQNTDGLKFCPDCHHGIDDLDEQ